MFVIVIKSSNSLAVSDQSAQIVAGFKVQLRNLQETQITCDIKQYIRDAVSAN